MYSRSDRLQCALLLYPRALPGRESMGSLRLCRESEEADRNNISSKFLAMVAEKARQNKLLPDEHFSVGGTLIATWASNKSFKPKDQTPQGDSPKGRNNERDFHGKELKNDTHASTTDPDAKLKEAKFNYTWGMPTWKTATALS